MGELQRVQPTDVGVDPSAILETINALETDPKIEMHSFMLLRHGKVAVEGSWKPFSPEKEHVLFSLSKSFTSTAVGFAVQEGLLTTGDTLYSFFKDILPAQPCGYMKKITIHNLLTMNTGHTKEPFIFTDEPESDWTVNFLTSYVDKEPGTIFTYNTAATFMLSAILQKVTGMRLMDYLKPRLFDPLGFEGYWWEESPDGINTGGFGLNLRIEAIARFGIFLLQKGMWEGRQLLSADWINMAASALVPNGSGKPDVPADDWNQGYGYQFWQCVPEGVYRGDGMHGQYCIVMPEQDAVLAIQSSTDDMQLVLRIIWDKLLPGMKDTKDFTAGTQQIQSLLEKKLSSLFLPLPEGQSPAAASIAAAVSGRQYCLSDNETGLRTLTLHFDGDRTELELDTKDGRRTFDIGFGKWLEGSQGFSREYGHSAGTLSGNHYAAAGAFQREDMYQLHIYFDRMTLALRVTLLFGEDWIQAVLHRSHSDGAVSLFGIAADKKPLSIN